MKQTLTASDFFSAKLAFETDCADVYTDIMKKRCDYVLLDVRSTEAFQKSHAITAKNLPTSEINAETLANYAYDTKFVVYCWGPGCNGATKAALRLSDLGYRAKEMIGGIHYWEDLERYPVNRRNVAIQQ
ncbi:sulfurtransferase [Alteromonadales bacterium alter-6D02]|nr:sulfurtransferase [Alteromonadales bacterium alter-6D02]